MNDSLFSSKTVEWETPQEFFNQLNEEFNFTLDPCCTDENAKCEKHFTKEQDGLAQDWTGETVYCNPPYGREMPKWIRKCYEHYRGGWNCRNADSCENRHESVSRVHIRESRTAVCSWEIEVRWLQKFCTVSVNGCCV